MISDQEITELRFNVESELFKFVSECKKKFNVNDEFIAFTILTYCGCFLGGAIPKKVAQRAFDMAFAMGDQISRAHERAHKP